MLCLKAAVELLVLFIMQGRETMEGRNVAISFMIYVPYMTYWLEYMFR